MNIQLQPYTVMHQIQIGVHIRDQSAGDNWSVNEVKNHIKEMLAVKFALKAFVKD